MARKPKREPEFKLQTDDDRLDDLAAEVLSILRAKAQTPIEAMSILEMAFYMICASQGANVQIALVDFNTNVIILQSSNEIKGHA